MWRRTDSPKLPKGFAVPPACGLPQCELVTYNLARWPIANLSCTHIHRNLFRKACGVEHAKGGAPGMAVNRDLTLAESRAYHVDQLVKIGKELFDCHGGGGSPAIE